MSDYPSHELHRENYLWCRSYLSQFPWQWMCRSPVRARLNCFSAQCRFKKWRMKLIDEEKLRVGIYLLTASKRGHIHFHALMIGRNRHGKTLHDCSRRRWESRWKGHARIKTIESNFGACDYLARHFFGWRSDRTEVYSFDRHLLHQEMRPQHGGLVQNIAS